ncbi:MAG: hypothetical protein EBS95_04740 [Chitinophagia bacterium]|nr:hypothetical protein [Chitinophagia bacterium]
MMDRSTMKSVEEVSSLFQAKAASLWKKGDKLFLACSGGMDSVVLGHLLKNMGSGHSLRNGVCLSRSKDLIQCQP